MSSPAPEIAPIDLKEKIEQQVRDAAMLGQSLYLRRSLGGISVFLVVSAIGTIFSTLRIGLAIGLCVWLAVWITSMILGRQIFSAYDRQLRENAANWGVELPPEPPSLLFATVIKIGWLFAAIGRPIPNWIVWLIILALVGALVAFAWYS
jgi:hypothetical protein